MIVKTISSFSKKRDRLIEKGHFTLEQYEQTRDTFKVTPKEKSIRPHKISCKKGETLVSLTIVPGTQYRILVNIKKCSPTVAIFSWIGKHREYESIIKDKRTCSSLFVKCEDVKEADEE